MCRHLDGHNVEIIDAIEIELRGARASYALTRPAECLQYCEAGGSKSGARKQARERGRRLAIGGKREQTGTGLQMRSHEVQRARMQRELRGVRQCPAQPGRSEAEGGGRRQRLYFPWIHVACQQGADAVEIRIARGEHADGASAMLQHFLYGAFEWAGPWPRRAANERCREREVASAAKDNLGPLHELACRGAQPVDAVFADADDGQPTK